jgi:DNA-binding CsgD family transcriptional regulator
VVRRVDGLSAREIEIAQMAADRKSNKTIGDALAISPRTVSTHLTHIYRKLDVTTREELADYVYRYGLR